jgi:general secretion pathway protein A
VESGKGLIVVTGEVGTGKTTILRWMMQRLDRAVLVGYVFNPRLTVPEFYQHVTRVLEVDEWETKSDLLFKLGKVLEARHARGLRTVLIIDEAHGLSTSVLEEIRLMSNFESDSAKLLQVVLTGQPELRDVLNDPALRQLKQRVALRCELRALALQETAGFIASRIRVAGGTAAGVFTREAVQLIHEVSGGIPRVISVLCDNALITGFAENKKPVGSKLVQDVCRDFYIACREDLGDESATASVTGTIATAAATSEQVPEKPAAAPSPEPSTVAAPVPAAPLFASVGNKRRFFGMFESRH